MNNQSEPSSTQIFFTYPLATMILNGIAIGAAYVISLLMPADYKPMTQYASFIILAAVMMIAVTERMTQPIVEDVIAWTFLIACCLLGHIVLAVAAFLAYMAAFIVAAFCKSWLAAHPFDNRDLSQAAEQRTHT